MPTIAHISDLHFFRVDPRAAEALVHELHQRRPTLIVVSGDLTQRARRRQFIAAAEYLRRLPAPQLVIPGNHDIPLFDVVRRFFFPLARYRRYITPELDPVFRDGDLLVIGLNTARSLTWKEGRISPQQMTKLRTELCRLPVPIKVIVTHHPFIPVPGEPHTVLVGRAADALNVMDNCGVDLLLAGHLHLGYHADVRTHHAAVTRSMLAIQAGTAISTRRREASNDYNWLDLEPGKVTLTIRSFDGHAFRDGKISQYTRQVDIWTGAPHVPA